MKSSFLLGLLALACTAALSGPAFTMNGDTVRLGDGACPAAIAALAKEKGLPDDMPLHSASATVGGKEYKACWTMVQENGIGVFYEDGDVGLIPAHEFKDDKSV